MFQLVLVPKDVPVPASLYYNEEAAARQAYDLVHQAQVNNDEVIRAKDDYGNDLSLPVENLSYVLFIDVEKSKPLHASLAPRIDYGKTN